jgi:hypothetical protein
MKGQSMSMKRTRVVKREHRLSDWMLSILFLHDAGNSKETARAILW